MQVSPCMAAMQKFHASRMDNNFLDATYFLEKYGELYKLVVFGQKCILQTRMEQRGDHMKMNFEYFQI